MKLAVLAIAVLLTGCGTSSHQNHVRALADPLKEYRDKINADIAAKKSKCAKLSDVRPQLTPKQVSAIEETVKEELKDPWSAHFKKIEAVSPKSGCEAGAYYGYYGSYSQEDPLVAQGFVNSKNSYGGYGGFTSFGVTKSGRVRIGG